MTKIYPWETHKVVDRLALDSEAGGLVRHQTLPLSRADRTTEVGLAALAELALTALYELIRTPNSFLPRADIPAV